MSSSEEPNDPPKAIQGRQLAARMLRQKLWEPANIDDNWFFGCMVGPEGSGKSLTTASILEKVDPGFTPNRVFWKPQKMLDAINELDKEERTGKAIMLDEAGVGMGVRTWYDDEQILLNKAFQTARDDNMIIMMTVPAFNLVDSQLRGRCKALLEMRDVEHGEYGEFSFKSIDIRRDETENIYKMYPRMRISGSISMIKTFKVGPPTDDFIELYESQKEEFKRELYEQAGDENDEEEEQWDPQNVVDEILEDGPEVPAKYVGEHSANGRVYISKDAIMAHLGLNHSEAGQVKTLLEDDGEIVEGSGSHT